MDRRKFLKNAMAGTGAGMLGAFPFSAGNQKTKSELSDSGTQPGDRPNVLFVAADQLRTQSCGYSAPYADDPRPYTPNIDRLAGQSTNFINAVSGYPMCAPCRASWFTGKYPSSTGMVINELLVMPDPDAIGHVLSNNGYHTGYIGKWHLYGDYNKGQFVPPGAYRLGFDDYWAAHNFHHSYYDGFYYNDTPDRIEIEGYEPHTQTKLAIDYMKQRRDEENPFALFVSYGPPHDPWDWENCPETFNQLFRDRTFPDPPNFSEEGHARYWVPSWGPEWYKNKWMPNRFRYRQVYAAMTASIDWEIGRILYALDELGLTDNTIVVFTSEHGEMFGSHGRVAKKIFYDEAARVPFLVRWPGQVQPRTSEACLNSPDIAPTLLGLTGLPIPDSMEGMDLSGIALGRNKEEPYGAFMQGMGHTFHWQNGDEWRAVRTKRHTYAKMLVDGSEYLFDNREDPYQTNNLIEDPGAGSIKTELKDWMKQKMNDLNDPFKPTTWYRDHWIKDDEIIVRSATRELEKKYYPENLGFKYQN